MAFDFIEKYTPHLSSLVSLSFSTNNVVLRRPFQTKLLFFQTVESAKHAFATRAGSGNPAFLPALFLEN